jgi:serine/threonine protein kinase
MFLLPCVQILKQCHHPNIISMYGYNFSVSRKEQYLVFEYAALGSLEKCLTDQENSVPLSVEMRLDIMFQIARSVHFLHSGGAGGHIIFHRDIKSPNIVLTENYTPKLIDCGLATLVRSDSDTSLKSVTNYIGCSGVYGTPGYVCPNFARNYGQQPYSAACDIFSFGVVLAEVICGKIQNRDADFYETYVLDECSLADDADSTIEWPSNILDPLCKLALRCMSPKPKNRPKSKDLTNQLSRLATLCFCSSNNLSTNHNQIKEQGGLACILCNRAATAGVHCNRQQHWTCIQCFNKEVMRQMGQDGTGIHCTVQGCTSGAFDNTYLYGKIDSEVYDLYVNARDQQEKLNQVIAGIDSLLLSNTLILRNHAYLATEDVKKCPSLVYMVPNDQKRCMNWPFFAVEKAYKLYFVCEKSLQVVEPAIEVNLSREWVVKIAPILSFGLFVLRTVALARGVPLPFDFQVDAMEGMVDALLDEDTKKLLHDTNSSSLECNPGNRVHTLMTTAHKMIGKIANQPKNTFWKEQMAPVLENQKLIWVKKEFLPSHHYGSWITQ